MKQLICLSDTPWRGIPTRTQQLLSRLHEVNVLFFEPPASGGNKLYKQPGRKMRPNLVVYTLPPLFLGGGTNLPILRRRNQAKLGSFALSVLEKHRFREPVLWTTTPENLFLVEAIPHRGLVYDCSREWDHLPLEWESELASLADVIFAASPGLAKRLSPCCDNIALIPNGVNYLMFTQAGLEIPTDLRAISGPILCRVGAVTPDLELEPLCHAASVHPEWTFLLIGPAAAGADQALAAYPNIRLLGPLSAPSIPDYLSASQVCFDLLSTRSRGSDILPPHLYEYLASARPIVSMLDQDQVEAFPDVIYTAHTPAEFVSRCERALQEDPQWVSGRRRRYASAARWSDRADEISRILETAGLF